MIDEKKFEDIVSNAPLAANEGTVSLTGAVQRSKEAGKFVLVLADGRNITLNISDVRDYQILGSMIGQPLVSVTVDSDKVPDGIQTTLHGTIAVVDNAAWSPIGMEGAQFGLNGQLGTQFGGGDPFYFAPAPMTAFALATPHAAPPEALNRMIALGVGQVTFPPSEYGLTNPHLDIHRGPPTYPTIDQIA